MQLLIKPPKTPIPSDILSTAISFNKLSNDKQKHMKNVNFMPPYMLYINN